MNLYLVRHGEAKEEKEAPELSLSERGRSQVKKVAGFLSSRADVRAKSIIHSEKLRARQTAELLAEFLSPPGGVTEDDALGPLADVSIWAERLVQTDDDIVLVGHVPFLGRLAGHLLCGDRDKHVVEFSTGGVVCLERARSGAWAVRWMVHPGLVP